MATLLQASDRGDVYVLSICLNCKLLWITRNREPEVKAMLDQLWAPDSYELRK